MEYEDEIKNEAEEMKKEEEQRRSEYLEKERHQ